MTVKELLDKHEFGLNYRVCVCREIKEGELYYHRFADKKVVQLDYADSEESPVDKYLVEYYRYEVKSFGITQTGFKIELVIVINI